MPTTKEEKALNEILPKQGLLYNEEVSVMVMNKPKILPLKSVTLEKIEDMQKQAQDFMNQEKKPTTDEKQ
uniref:BBSome-interacting protein 1 n=1 Tax=Amphimedon queenslandica TaxID=400682 RepID=A0A1X7UH16_AMPQE